MEKQDPELKELIKIAIDLSGQMPEGHLKDSAEAIPLSRGGSGRNFFRLADGERSAVALIQAGGGIEFNQYVSIGDFLHREGIGVPEFYSVDHDHGVIVMEDLGDLHLEDALRKASDEECFGLYGKCIEILVQLETAVTENMDHEGILHGRIFDRETLLAETEYFMREFIDGFCPVTLPDGWARERAQLATFLSDQPRVFMHRDFQSRNILVKKGRMRIVDFQAAHRGPGLYDAASLLKDPYHPIPNEMGRVLLQELHDGLKDRGNSVSVSFDEFYEAFTTAGIQRNLQALAAFVHLGISKGKREFLDSIPAGISLLEAGLEESGRFPALRTIVSDIREKLQKG
jgi:aminoglycoside/choline kinase family phosphotransferase